MHKQGTLLFFGAFVYFLFLTNGLSFHNGDSYEWITYGSNGWQDFLHHPRWDRPGFLMLHLLLFPFFGLNPTGYYVIRAFFFAVSILLVWLLSKKLTNTIFFSWLAAITTALSFDMITYPHLFIGDAAGIEQPLILITIYSYLRFQENNNARWAALSLLTLFFATSMKQTARLIPFALLIHLLITKKKNILREPITYGLIAIILLNTLLFYETPHHTIAFHHEHWKNFAAIIIATLLPLILTTAASLSFAKLTPAHHLLIIWLFTTFLQISLFPHIAPRYAIGIMIPLIIFTISITQQGLQKLSHYNKITAVITIALIIILTIQTPLEQTTTFLTTHKPYLITKEHTRQFLENNLANTLILYYWGDIDFFGAHNNEYKNYNPTITANANLTKYIEESNKPAYIIQYPRSQSELSAINKTLYASIKNGPIEFVIWNVTKQHLPPSTTPPTAQQPSSHQ